MANIEKATFAAGCFWGVEASFRAVPGVSDAICGYIGGHKDNPTYEEVCRTDTGHAEAVEVSFDPGLVSFEQLVEHFWALHNPTQKDRQGPDVGRQYRSAIFTHSDDQARIAAASKDKAQANFAAPIATVIEPAATFWKAEEYHQRYFEKKGGGAHCAI